MHLKVPTACPHPQADQSSPCLPIPLKILFNIILNFTPRSSKWSLSLRHPHQNLYAPLLSPMRAIWSVHLIHLITWIFCEYRPWSSSLCSFFSPLIASDINATAPYFDHWLPSPGRFILINQKKCHTCYSPVTLITRRILPKHLTFDPVFKKKYIL